MGKTSIEWTSRSWNPIRGCSIVSSGCKNCYAMNFATRFAAKGEAYEGLAYRNSSGAHWTGEVKFIEKHLADPLKVRKPTKWFVNSMSDLFHESIPDEWIDKIFAVMSLASQHTFQVLTKRPERMLIYMQRLSKSINPLEDTARSMGYTFKFENFSLLPWPIPNIHLGVSVEDQKTADERIPFLFETPAAVRWVSAEPLLGSVEITQYLHDSNCDFKSEAICLCSNPREVSVDWVVVGGESGPRARGCDLDNLKLIVEQCKAASVPVFVKQLGAHPFQTRPAEGRDGSVDYALANLNEVHPQRQWFKDWTLVTQGRKSVWVRGLNLKNKKGGDPSEWPEDLRVREFPA